MKFGTELRRKYIFKHLEHIKSSDTDPITSYERLEKTFFRYIYILIAQMTPYNSTIFHHYSADTIIIQIRNFIPLYIRIEAITSSMLPLCSSLETRSKSNVCVFLSRIRENILERVFYVAGDLQSGSGPVRRGIRGWNKKISAWFRSTYFSQTTWFIIVFFVLVGKICEPISFIFRLNKSLLQVAIRLCRITVFLKTWRGFRVYKTRYGYICN